MSRAPELTEAIAAFQRGDLDRALSLAEQSGGTAEAEHLLGLIHCRRGDLASGIEHLERAAAAEPINAAHRLMLARALVDSGRAAEVLTMPEPPVDNVPSSLALWHARAEAADAVGDPRTAKLAWQIVATARPSDWRAWSNLGNACAALEEWEDSADALRRAVAIKPDEPSIRRNLAGALGNGGAFEEAVAELEQAVRLEPDHVESRLTLAQLLADLGRHQEALAELAQASQLAASFDAEQGRGRWLIDLIRLDQAGQDRGSELAIGRIRKFGVLLERTNQMDALLELLDEAVSAGVDQGSLGYLWAARELRDGKPEEARRLLLTESPDHDPVRWHRLLAKIEDARGDAAPAFAAAEAMNHAVRDFDEWRAKGAEYRRRIHALAPIITDDWAGRLPTPVPSGRRSPAFLVGFPRSGTTLLDTFLMGHPDTEVLEEVHMLGAAELVVGKVAELPNCPSETLLEARKAYFAELDRHIGPTFQGLVVDKLPLNMLGLPLIHSLFPDARIIFAQRHPCDAILSGFMQSFVMNDAMACFLTIEDAADLYDAVMDVFTRSREALPVQVHTLVYEELVANPEAALKPLIDFLGLDWNDELLDHRATARKRGAIITPSYDQVTEPLSRRPSGRWRRYERQLEPVLPILLPWAKRLGYDD